MKLEVEGCNVCRDPRKEIEMHTVDGEEFALCEDDRVKVLGAFLVELGLRKKVEVNTAPAKKTSAKKTTRRRGSSSRKVVSMDEIERLKT